MSDEIHDFRYFIVGDSIPVKLALDAQGRSMGTLGPDKETGAFKIEMKYFADVMDGDNANEVDLGHFDKTCETYFK